MRRTSGSVALAAFLCVAALPLACDDGVRLSLQLRTAAAGDPVPDASALQTLTVIVDNGVDAPDGVSFEINRAEQVLVPPLAITKETPFNMEVWGCNRDTCNEPDVKLRGCTPTALNVSDRSDTVIVAIEMRDFLDDILQQCPGVRAAEALAP